MPYRDKCKKRTHRNFSSRFRVILQGQINLYLSFKRKRDRDRKKDRENGNIGSESRARQKTCRCMPSSLQYRIKPTTARSHSTASASET